MREHPADPVVAPDRRAMLLALATVAAPGFAMAQAQAPAPLALPPLPEGARAIKDVTFIERPTGPLKLDIYIPPGPGPHPLIMWVHGGGWYAGDKADPAALFFMNEGYAVVSANYRLADQAPFPAPLLDCKAAIRFVRAKAPTYGLDPRRIIAAGPMSGGHLASLLGVTGGLATFREPLHLPKDDGVQAVMALYGVHDLIAWRGLVGGVDHDVPGGSESKMLGAFVLDRPDLARAASPTTYVRPTAPPFLLIHGRLDQRVPWPQSKLMDSSLKLAGVDSELWIAENAIHADPSFWSKDSRARMSAFFKRALSRS